MSPEKPRSPLSSMSRSPSPSAKQTAFLLSRVTLMRALVTSCSESLVIFSRFVPRSTTRMGQGPRTSYSWAGPGLLMGSTNCTLIRGEAAWKVFMCSWPEARSGAEERWKYRMVTSCFRPCRTFFVWSERL